MLQSATFDVPAFALGATVRVLATGEAGRIVARAEWPDLAYLVGGKWYGADDIEALDFDCENPKYSGIGYGESSDINLAAQSSQ
jgi:hypothetical protein